VRTDTVAAPGRPVERTLSVPTTLLGPVTSLQTQLAFLATTLPPSSVSIFYRQIASGLSTHILSRVFKQRSRGKLTEQNGQTIEAEAQLWLQCCRQVVGKVVRRVDVPWQDLLEAARLVSTPEGPSFMPWSKSPGTRLPTSVFKGLKKLVCRD
jgi:hypothetical protein